VASVIGGWFFTAFSAFTVAFLFALAIKFGGFVAIVILIGLAVFFVYKTHVIHKKRSEDSEDEDLKQLRKTHREVEKTQKFIDAVRKKQVKRIKANEVGTRNSMLFLGLLSEYKNLMLRAVNLTKSYRDFSHSVEDKTETN
jgi:Na+/H+ antiporter NhaB